MQREQIVEISPRNSFCKESLHLHDLFVKDGWHEMNIVQNINLSFSDLQILPYVKFSETRYMNNNKKRVLQVYVQKAMHLLQLVCQDRSIFEKITNLFDKWNHLQALRVVAVQSGASCAGDTSGRASVSNSSALPVMSDTSGGSSPCASWAPRTASGARGWWSGCEGGVNRAPFDVGVGDWCRGWVLFNISWRTGGCWARSSSHAWCACLLSWWVRGIKPQHLRGVVIPDGHNENHSLF